MKKEENKSSFTERIRIKKNQKKFIIKEKSKIKFRTQAGTLDYVINFYKKYNKINLEILNNLIENYDKSIF